MIILFDLSFKIPFKTLSRFGFQLLPNLIKDVFDFCKINVRKNKINKKKKQTEVSFFENGYFFGTLIQFISGISGNKMKDMKIFDNITL